MTLLVILFLIDRIYFEIVLFKDCSWRSTRQKHCYSTVGIAACNGSRSWIHGENSKEKGDNFIFLLFKFCVCKLFWFYRVSMIDTSKLFVINPFTYLCYLFYLFIYECFFFVFFCRVWVKMSVLGNSLMTLCCSSWLVKTLCLVTLCSVLANPNLTHFTKLWTLGFGRLKNCFQVINWRLIRDSNLTSQRTEWFDNSTGGFQSEQWKKPWKSL